MSKAKDKSLKYEDALEQLEALIDRIESGEVGLEESLTAYEQGMKLITHCRTILGAAEKKIAELSINDAGKLVTTETPDASEPTPDDEPM
ncbi:MAG: exodeoxyribonuclease VII small subunit [Phycisphaerales bacterium]|nr:exodeoxyribonuclease VII small subunit [Phycisphaerales bacterium]